MSWLRLMKSRIRFRRFRRLSRRLSSRAVLASCYGYWAATSFRTLWCDGMARTDRPVSSARSSFQSEIRAADIVQTGQSEITVFNPEPGGGSSSALVLVIDIVSNPVPVLSALDPPSATAGSGTFTLSLTGSGFLEGSQVRWDGADRPTAFVSSSELQAEISDADVAQVGQVEVTVFNPQPGGGSSSPLAFVIDPVPNPVPVLSSLDPPSATEGSDNLTLNLMGSGFFEGSQVLWNGATRPTTFVDSTHLQAEISASDLAVAGPVEVAVFNPAPGGGTSSGLLFDVVEFTAPEISEAEVEVLSTDLGADPLSV